MILAPWLSPVAVVLGLLVGTALPASGADKSGEAPAIDREFRAAWIATVANIDWPTKPGLSTAEQQAELIALLDTSVRLNLNAVILQVRPSCDALYASELEPWSEFLTGQMGEAPAPLYDPLAFAVEEAHARGLELHAWFNPYRALHTAAKSPVADSHIIKSKPNVAKQYGGYWWLDPGEPEAVDHSIAVMIDVVQRYDVDGVHLDDYFYPYPINDDAGKPVAFPDDASYQRAVATGSKLDRDDWRRQNVDQFVERLYREIKQCKRWVKFGISPFGIWRPGNPPQIKGFDQYAAIYADARKWFVEGWLDYFTPQLYWKLGPPAQSYPALLGWWHEQNEQGRHLWPGNYTSKLFAEGKSRWPAEEIIAQIWATRAQEGADGNVHFSMKALAHNSGGIAEQLLAGPYQHPALVPASPWLADSAAKPAPQPVVEHDDSGEELLVRFRTDDGEPPWLWAVRTRYGAQWQVKIVPGLQSELKLRKVYDTDGMAIAPEEVAVTSVDRIGQESAIGSATFHTP
ncbi:MAG: family 10 glycosylhydrolase [Planctomycetales bacterium]|nr:family 10 glycosylhydrolase [Planctomycetales bacterium]